MNVQELIDMLSHPDVNKDLTVYATDLYEETTFELTSIVHNQFTICLTGEELS